MKHYRHEGGLPHVYKKIIFSKNNGQYQIGDKTTNDIQLGELFHSKPIHACKIAILLKGRVFHPWTTFYF